MARGRSLSTAVVISLFVALIALYRPVPAWALSCSSHANWHDGAYHEPSVGQTYGAWAEINIRDPDLCTTSSSTDSSAWSMVASDSAGYFQIGYLKNSDGVFNFTETSKNGILFTTELHGATTVGSKWGYKTKIQSDGHGHMYRCVPGAGGSCFQYDETGWEPFNLWSGTHAEFFGEFQHYTTDVPGTSSLRENFSEVQEIKGSGDWYTGGLVMLTDAGEVFKKEWLSDDHFKIWTER